MSEILPAAATDAAGAAAALQPLVATADLLLLFRVGERRLAIEGRGLQEVARIDAVTPLPRGPAYLLGVASLRGTVLPLVALEPVLGEPLAARELPLTALVLRARGMVAGVAVDEVLGLEPAGEREAVGAGESLPAGLAALVTGRCRPASGSVLVLDPERALPALRLRQEARPPASRPQSRRL